MNDIIVSFLKEPFVLGFKLGLLIVVFIIILYIKSYFNARKKRKELIAQNMDLTKNLKIQMDINAEGNRSLKEKNINLEESMKNLKSTLEVVKGKSDNVALLFELEKHKEAVKLLTKLEVDFSQKWLRVLDEAEEQIIRINNGNISLLKTPIIKLKYAQYKACQKILK